MKETLAKRLVADLMDWSVDRATNEFAWLDLMVNYKFDSYQQYGPGHRFYVHLLRWLSQLRISAIVDACFRLIVDGVAAPSWTRGGCAQARSSMYLNRPRSV